jgi:hypothetical protein
MQAGLRAWINLANGSTLAGLGVAALGGARVARGADRLFVGTGLDGLDPASALFRHEARHATQYACCGGLVMVPLYLAAAAVSWLLTGDTGCRNVFERRAGLTDGGYTDKPLRPALRRAGGSVAQAR